MDSVARGGEKTWGTQSWDTPSKKWLLSYLQKFEIPRPRTSWSENYYDTDAGTLLSIAVCIVKPQHTHSHIDIYTHFPCLSGMHAQVCTLCVVGLTEVYTVDSATRGVRSTWENVVRNVCNLCFALLLKHRYSLERTFQFLLKFLQIKL